MPVDRPLPPPRLSLRASAGEIVQHFPERSGVRVDLAALDALPALERLSLAGARLPEPPEAVLLDRVLQLVPAPLLAAVDRILIVDTGETGRPGSYLGRIVRVRTPALRLREGDPVYGGQFSVFTTTVLHEIGHAVYEELLTPRQRDLVLVDYISFLERSGAPSDGEPTEAGVQHHLSALLLTALLGYSKPFMSVVYARSVLAEIGISGSPKR
jgi:hypothetical protein